MTVEQKSNGYRGEMWTKIGMSVGGGLLLAMQGINISETSGQTSLIERIDKALEQQLNLTREINQEGVRIDKALTNQQEMIQSMDTLLANQNVALNILQKETTKPANGQ